MRRWATVAMLVVLALHCVGCRDDQKAGSGYLQLRLASNDPKEGWIEVKVHDISRPVYVCPDETPDVKFTDADVAEASLVPLGTHTGKPLRYGGKIVKHGIAIKFTDRAAKRMEKLTAKHRDERLAIMVAGRVIAAPRITTPIKEKLLFYGSLDEKDSKTLVSILQRK